MKRIAILASLILFHTPHAVAGPPASLQQNILASAHKARNGVIVAVSEQGNIAADTAWLLAAQVNRDSSYVPFLLTFKPEERQEVLKTLRLTEASLPALIYYNHEGKEISRIIGALPTPSIKKVRSSDSAAAN